MNIINSRQQDWYIIQRLYQRILNIIERGNRFRWYVTLFAPVAPVSHRMVVLVFHVVQFNGFSFDTTQGRGRPSLYILRRLANTRRHNFKMFIIIKYKSELAQQQQQFFSFFLYFIACPTKKRRWEKNQLNWIAFDVLFYIYVRPTAKQRPILMWRENSKLAMDATVSLVSFFLFSFFFWSCSVFAFSFLSSSSPVL